MNSDRIRLPSNSRTKTPDGARQAGEDRVTEAPIAPAPSARRKRDRLLHGD